MTRTIADRLVEEIESFSTRLQESHPLMVAAQQGRVGPKTAAAYLAGLKFVCEYSLIHLRQAEAVALSRGDSELASHFVVKYGEEDGHALWAVSDLRELQSQFGVSVPSAPDAFRAMMDRVTAEIEAQPQHYLAYMIFAEHLTVHAGGAWVAVLTEHCQIPVTALGVVTRHIELDRHHVAEGKRVIDQLLRDMAQPEPMFAFLHSVMHCFERVCDELYGIESASHSVRPRPSSTPLLPVAERGA